MKWFVYLFILLMQNMQGECYVLEEGESHFQVMKYIIYPENNLSFMQKIK